MAELSASYYVQEEFAPDHAERLARRPWVSDNRWPRELPGFREVLLEYFTAMAALGRRILSLQSIALGLGPDYLPCHEAFGPPRRTLRLLHYPPRNPELAGQYGFAPHTDFSFFTITAQDMLPGLEFMAAPEEWVPAPAPDKRHFMVMTGDMSRFWTNDRFRVVAHRVINNNGRERYSIPFFITPRIDVAVGCFPGCSGPSNPPRHRQWSAREWMAEKWASGAAQRHCKAN
jgi:isopenicillin N synthase-like dioxygenase